MEKIGPRTEQSEAKRDGMKKFWKKQTPAKEELRHTRGKAIAVFAMALAIAVGGTGTWTLLADQPAGLTVEPAAVQTAAPEKTKSDRRSKKAEATAEKAERPAAESEGELPAEEPEGSAAEDAVEETTAELTEKLDDAAEGKTIPETAETEAEETADTEDAEKSEDFWEKDESQLKLDPPPADAAPTAPDYTAFQDRKSVV